MQMKNVNLLQNCETSEQSTGAGPPLPPRASSQLGGRPPSTQNNHHHGVHDQSLIYSPYKSVPVPKPIPPPYRQPPFPNPQYGTVGQRLNNDPLMTMPGSADPDDAPSSPVYVTHSSKFPIKQEPSRPQTASRTETGKRIPHLAEVVRQQRPRTANTVMPDPGPQPLGHQAWSENERSRRAPFVDHEWEPTSNEISVDGHDVDEGERLLVRSRSGPLYPSGVDNKSLVNEEHGYIPSQPHQRLEGARGQVLMERRPNPIPIGPEDAPLYRAHFVTTGEPTAAPQRGTLRDTCSRLYDNPSTQAIHSSMQDLKGSMISLHSATGRLQFNSVENPYVTKEEVLATAQSQQPLYEAHSGTVPPPRQFRSTADDPDDASELGHEVEQRASESRVLVHDDSVRSAYEPNGTGPRHRYYHLKDMTSGPCEDLTGSNVASHDVKGVATTTNENESSSKAATVAASEEDERVYGPVKRGAIYGVLQQQQQQFTTQSVRNIAQRFQQSFIESDKEQPKVGTAAVESSGSRGVPNDDVSVPTSKTQLPVSPSAVSTSSESGRGTMPIKSSGSPISGGTLNTSFDSDVGGRNRIPSTGMMGENTNSNVDKRPQMMPKSLAATTLIPQPSATQCAGTGKWTDTAENELRQILDVKMQKPRSSGTGAPGCISARRSDRHSVHDTTFSDSFSITPPLPPLSPVGTPPSLHSRNSKYKLSLSSGNLHKSSGTTPDILETTRRGPVHSSKEANMRLLSKKAAQKGKSTSSSQELRSWTAKKYTPLQSRVPGTSAKNSLLYTSRLRGSEISLGAVVSHDGEVTSTTTGLDMDSLLDDGDLSTDDGSSQTSRAECDSEMNNIRQQLESLEAMYSEVMKVLGVKGAQPSQLAGQRSLHDLRPSRRRVFGSLTSLTGKVGRSATGAAKERTGQHHDRKKNRESKSVGRRFQRLESHVVTLARSVAHLSSEMRTQHIMFQELESLRQEVAQLQGQHRGGGKFVHGGGNAGVAGRAWDNFRSTIPSLTNPARIKKLTKFFGDEPPLLRLFLKKLGYEKYAPQFEAEKIGIVELPYLTEERLQKIGIPMGPRMRILQEAQLSFRQEHFNIYIV